MKKFFLISLIATFVTIFSASAQDNTYNMVIKMANGTTFTIGPKDVENITFNDGEVVVSGSSIQELIASITENASRIAENAKRITDNEMRIEDTNTRIAADEAAINTAAIRAEAYYQEYLNNMKMLSDQIRNCATVEELVANLSNYYTKEEVTKLLADITVNGNVWTIGPDGYWYLNGVITTWRAVGMDGKDGKDGMDGAPGPQGAQGAQGEPGVPGPSGRDGYDGRDGTSWMISDATKNWLYSNDGGATWTDTGICAEGKGGTGDVDLSNYYTKEKIDSMMATLEYNMVTKVEMEALIQNIANIIAEKYSELKDKNALLEAQTEYLKNEVLKNTQEIDMLRNMIETLREEVSELKK